MKSKSKDNVTTGKYSNYYLLFNSSRFERTKKSRSMENLAQGEVHYTATPTGSPAFGSKFSKGFLRARQNSESDLETACMCIKLHVLYLVRVIYYLVGSLFRSGSKKNLLIDATEGLLFAITLYIHMYTSNIINVYIALFDAIENQDISQCQSLLEEQDIDLNALSKIKLILSIVVICCFF